MALGLLVVVVWIIRASSRGQTQIARRLAAVIVLLLAAEQTIRFVVDPDRVSGYVLVIMAFAVLAIAVNAARGSFRAPSR